MYTFLMSNVKPWISDYVSTLFLKLPFISMIHFDWREISRELKGLTLTATLTEDILLSLFVQLRRDESQNMDFSGKKIIIAVF